MESLLSRFASPQAIVGRQDALILNPNGTLTHRYLTIDRPYPNPSLPTNVRLDTPITSVTQVMDMVYLITCDGQLHVLIPRSCSKPIHLHTPAIKVAGYGSRGNHYCLTATGAVYLIRGVADDIGFNNIHYYEKAPLVQLELPVVDMVVGDWRTVALLQDRSLVELKLPELTVNRMASDDSVTPSSLTFHGADLIVTVTEPDYLVLYKQGSCTPVILRTPYPVNRFVTQQNIGVTLLLSVDGRVYHFTHTGSKVRVDLVKLPFRVADVFLGVKGYRVFVTEEGRIYWSEGGSQPIPL